MKIHKGDTVKIIAGNDKNKTGKVLAVFMQEGRIAVEGLNIKKKHVRPLKQGRKGEMVLVPAPFSVSRVMLLCSKCGKAARAEYQMDGNKKVRICKKCGGEI